MDHTTSALRAYRFWLTVFLLGLVASGLTALPLSFELSWLDRNVAAPGSSFAACCPDIAAWIHRVHFGLSESYARHPWIAYGTDWLAFGHLVLALGFLGAWKDPLRNRWLIEFGLLACASVVPFAAIAGGIRGIPWAWRAIDMSFGVFGAVPLLFCRRALARIARVTAAGRAARLAPRRARP